MTKFKLNSGDVISIPLSAGLLGFGQIVSPYEKKSGGFLMAIFDFKSNLLDTVMLSTICNSPVILLGFTFDAKIYHKHWSVIGNYTENIKEIKTPYFRLGTPPGDIYLIDAENNRVAEISEQVFNQLLYRSDISPIRYENALKAYFGMQKWITEDYDKILYTYTLKSNEIAQNILHH